MHTPGIEVRLNTEATPEMVKELKPDAVLIGIGSEPILPRFAGNGAGKVVWVGDVELKRAAVGEKVIMAGGGFTGLEAALTLAREGKEVTVIDMLPLEKIGADGITISMIALKKLLADAGVRFVGSVRLKDVTESGAVLENTESGREEVLPCDTVVLSLGVRPDRNKIAAFEDIAEETYVVGDCAVRAGTLENAVGMGYSAAREI